MCRSRWRPNSDLAEFYALGIQRTMRIAMRRSYFLDDISSEETSEELDSNEALLLASPSPFRPILDLEDPFLGGKAAEDYGDEGEYM